jgi:hypothetical protein
MNVIHDDYWNLENTKNCKGKNENDTIIKLVVDWTTCKGELIAQGEGR